MYLQQLPHLNPPIQHFISFLSENDIDIYKLCTYIISEKDKEEGNFNYTDKDIKYPTHSDLDHVYFLVFLSDVKEKANGKNLTCIPPHVQVL